MTRARPWWSIPQDTQTLQFYNDPMCSLTLTKLDSVTGKPVPNTEFTVKDGDGNVLGRYVTGKDGTVVVTGLIPNSTVVVSETRVPDGYVLNSTPKTIIVKNGSGNSWTSGGNSSGGSSSGGNSGGNDLTFENDPQMTLTIHKYIEGTTNEPLRGHPGPHSRNYRHREGDQGPGGRGAGQRAEVHPHQGG